MTSKSTCTCTWYVNSNAHCSIAVYIHDPITNQSALFEITGLFCFARPTTVERSYKDIPLPSRHTVVDTDINIMNYTYFTSNLHNWFVPSLFHGSLPSWSVIRGGNVYLPIHTCLDRFQLQNVFQSSFL
jgi:hypothetical protein